MTLNWTAPVWPHTGWCRPGLTACGPWGGAAGTRPHGAQQGATALRHPPCTPAGAAPCAGAIGDDSGACDRPGNGHVEGWQTMWAVGPLAPSQHCTASMHLGGRHKAQVHDEAFRAIEATPKGPREMALLQGTPGASTRAHQGQQCQRGHRSAQPALGDCAPLVTGRLAQAPARRSRPRG